MSCKKLPTELLVSREIAKAWLEKQIREGKCLRQTQADSYEQYVDFRKRHYNWTSSNIDLLLGIFTTEEMANRYAAVSRFDSDTAIDPTLVEQSRDLVIYIDALILQIESIIQYLEAVPLSSDTVSAADR